MHIMAQDRLPPASHNASAPAAGSGRPGPVRPGGRRMGVHDTHFCAHTPLSPPPPPPRPHRRTRSRSTIPIIQRTCKRLRLFKASATIAAAKSAHNHWPVHSCPLPPPGNASAFALHNVLVEGGGAPCVRAADTHRIFTLVALSQPQQLAKGGLRLGGKHAHQQHGGDEAVVHDWLGGGGGAGAGGRERALREYATGPAGTQVV